MYILVNDQTFDGKHILEIKPMADRASARLELAKLVKAAEYAPDIPMVNEVPSNYMGQVIESNTLDDFYAYLNNEMAVDYTHIYIKDLEEK